MKDLDSNDMNSKEAELLAQEAAKYINVIATTPLQQIGEMFGDRFRVWRYKQAIKLLIDVKKYHAKKGIKTREIPVKTLLPILENASLEEDENIKGKWTALLINATNENNSYDLHNVCIELLKQLSPKEVKILDKWYDKSKEFDFKGDDCKFSIFFLKEDYPNYDDKIKETEKVIIHNLQRLNLIEFTHHRKLKETIKNDDNTLSAVYYKNFVRLTFFGRKFIQECRIDE